MKSFVQDAGELDSWYHTADPWGYETNPHDQLRKMMLLSELPARNYSRVLDVGCGQGFVTRDLPGDQVVGIDISGQAIWHAKNMNKKENIHYRQGSIFELETPELGTFDLIVITGVLYPQYVGNALGVIYQKIDSLLAENGILVSVHIDTWYKARFPLLKFQELFYDYREYTHRLELYQK